jgi:hypothetical protein
LFDKLKGLFQWVFLIFLTKRKNLQMWQKIG